MTLLYEIQGTCDFYIAMFFEGETSSMLFTFALLSGIQRDNILFSDLFSHCAFACSKLFHGLHFGVCSCFLQLVMPDVSILDVPMLQAQEGKPQKKTQLQKKENLLMPNATIEIWRCSRN